MSRPLRPCLPGALYHVIARGNNRERIVRDDADRASFLTTLAEVVPRYAWLCHAFCLLDNHYHLVIETPRPNLPLGMRQLNGLYARRFNRRHNRGGHVFQARYRAVLVEKETYLLELSRYVVLNPVRACICTDPADRPWSSYRSTATGNVREPFLTTDWLLAQFATSRHAACAAYRQFVSDGLRASGELHVRGERLGSEPFLRDDLRHDRPLPEVPREQWQPLRPPLAEIFEQNPPP